MFKLSKRCAKTTIRLPLAVTRDLIRLWNMGEFSSINNVVKEYKNQKNIDDVEDLIKVYTKYRRERI